jgi:hypothetical protein
MFCPQCIQKIHRGAGVCPHCGFSLAEADEVFGDAEVSLASLADTAGLLRQRERAPVAAAMAAFNRRFPQLFVAVFSGRLGDVNQLRPFGFWLLNRAVFKDLPDRSNAAAILLVIDPESKTAGLTFGYFLDAYLDETDTFDCLAAGHPYWLEGDFAGGIVRVIGRLRAVLAKRSRQARRRPEKFARRVLPPLAAESGAAGGGAKAVAATRPDSEVTP